MHREVRPTKTMREITLLELIVVIAILAIAAGMAYPRFVELHTESRVALVTSLGGSVNSAASQAHYMWILQGRPAMITMEGQTVTMLNGYPDESTIDDTLMDYSGFKFQTTTLARFRREDAPQPNTCMVTYEEANPGLRPSVTAYTSGC